MSSEIPLTNRKKVYIGELVRGVNLSHKAILMYSVCDPFFGKGNTGNRTLLNRSAAHNKAKSSSKII